MNRYSYLMRVAKKLLKEAEETEVEGVDSLDAQLDKYFVDYETEAKNVKAEGMNFRSLSKRILLEAEPEEEDPPAEEEGEEESTDEEGEGDEAEKEGEEEPEKLSLEDLDVGSFVTDVMRLVENYDTLLEVRNTILRRAANFLAKNYTPDVVTAFEDQLSEDHGVEIGKSKYDVEDSFQAPKAGNAGPMGGGGA